MKCIKEVTDGSGRVRFGRPCRILVSEMLRGSPVVEVDATSKCDDGVVPVHSSPPVWMESEFVLGPPISEESLETVGFDWHDSCMRTVTIYEMVLYFSPFLIYSGAQLTLTSLSPILNITSLHTSCVTQLNVLCELTNHE